MMKKTKRKQKGIDMIGSDIEFLDCFKEKTGTPYTQIVKEALRDFRLKVRREKVCEC